MSYIKSLDTVSRWGHYEVNGKKYYVLREAYEAAKSARNIHFNFHDKIFSFFAQQGEPRQSLDSLYRLRVEQIRKKYDHVVLCYSGGADSHNILKYFELTGTHLDEIVTIEDSSIRGRDSVISGEVFKVAIPDVEKFQEKFPKTKFRLLDAKEYQDKIFFDQSFEFDPVYGLTYQFKPVSMLFQGWWAYFIDDYKKLHDQGKTVGIVWAIDKPRTRYVPGTGYKFFFSDFHSIVGHKHLFIKHNFFQDEAFYWTAELPQLPIKQAYVTAQYLEQTDAAGFNPTRGLDQPVNCAMRKSGKAISYEFINPVIYPYWSTDTFTYGKERHSYLVSKRDDSLITANDPELQLYSSAIQSLLSRHQSVGEFMTVKDFDPASNSTEIAGIKCLYSYPYSIHL